MGQDTTKLGETAYADETGWNDRSVNWTQLLSTPKGQSGSIEEDRMDRILGRNRRTISQEIVNLCTEDMKPLEIKLVNNSLGMKRPSLGVMSYKVGQCEVQLSDAGAYNDHMRDIHGVDTELRGTINSNLYPDINRPSAPSHNPNDRGINSLLGILAPTLKSLDVKGGK